MSIEQSRFAPTVYRPQQRDYGDNRQGFKRSTRQGRDLLVNERKPNVYRRSKLGVLKRNGAPQLAPLAFYSGAWYCDHRALFAAIRPHWLSETAVPFLTWIQDAGDKRAGVLTFQTARGDVAGVIVVPTDRAGELSRRCVLL